MCSAKNKIKPIQVTRNLNLDNRIAEDEKNTKLILQKNDKDKKREAKASETNELETVSDDRTNNFLTMESLILAQEIGRAHV